MAAKRKAAGGGPDGAKAKAPRKRRRTAAEPRSRGLPAPEAVRGEPPAAIAALRARIEQDGGAVVGAYRDPLGGHWQVLAALPIDRVQPTPFQRDLSDPHVERLVRAIGALGRFLDPVIAVRTEEGVYWVPNGYHRTEALRRMGARSVAALVLPEPEVAFRILALNTEKAHNLRERALEVIRMARTLAGMDPLPEKDYETTFEEAALVTLGICYEQRPRFSGGAYHPVLRRVDAWLPQRLPKALEQRADRARRLLALDDAVVAAVAALKERGFESPYLKNFVLARVNPLRFQRGGAPEFDATIARMTAAAERFDAAKVKADQVAATGGPPPE